MYQKMTYHKPLYEKHLTEMCQPNVDENLISLLQS